MTSPGKLQGKTALVTGGARGLGRAFALRLARLGADVAIADIDLHSARAYPEEGMVDTVDEDIRSLGGRSLGLVADVTRPADCAAVVDQVLHAFGRVDILVNNAGGLVVPVDRSWASSMPEDDLEAMLRLNLKGAIYCSQAVSPHLRRQHAGKIVNVGSVVGLRTSRGNAAHYSIAKAALHQYTRLLAAELGPFGVTVNCLAPGWILTARTIAGGRNEPETRARLEANVALRRLGTPEDCARVLEFLATELSDYVTGPGDRRRWRRGRDRRALAATGWPIRQPRAFAPIASRPLGILALRPDSRRAAGCGRDGTLYAPHTSLQTHSRMGQASGSAAR